MGFDGLDPQQVVLIARKLAAQQRRVESVAQTVDTTVNSARSVWRGADVDAFLASWNGTHRRQLLAAGAALAELAIRAYANAEDQQRVSLAYGGPSGAAGTNVGPILSQLRGIQLFGGTSGAWGRGGDVAGATVVAGIPMSGRVSAFAGARGNAEYHVTAGPAGLDAAASAKGFAGARADASGQFGNPDLSASGQASALVGLDGRAEASAKLGPDAAAIALGASGLAGAQALAGGTIGDRYSNLSGTAQAFAGAQGSADDNASIGPDGVSARAGVSGFAGAEATADGSMDVGGFSLGSGVGAEAGVGFDAEASASVTANDVGFSLNLGGALGIGGDVDISASVDPAQVYGELSSAWNTAGSELGTVTGALGGLTGDLGL